MSYTKEQLIVESLPYAFGQKRIQIQTREKVVQMFGEMYPDVLGEC